VALLTLFGVTAVFAPSASASLTSFGPIDPATNFPTSYTDSNGLSLQLCLGLPNCLADTDFVQIHEDGGDAEAFYYAADATAGPITVHNALEAAYAANGPNQEVVFMRSQVSATDGGLTAGEEYTITDPYGTLTCTADAEGRIVNNACRTETTPVEVEFGRALGGRIGPFLTWDTFAAPTGAPPAGFIGDNATPHEVVGSPTGFNAVRVTGPDLEGTCTDPDGSTVNECEETHLFIVQGKVQAGGASASVSSGRLDFGDIPATPPAKKSLTYANTGSVPVTINSIAVGGTNASAFTSTNTCPTAPDTLAVGTRCTIDVTFTPEPGRSSAATLTITDDTPAATRNVDLKGSNLGKLVVADPAPPAALAFDDQSTTSPSPQNHVVIGNTGNGPLTIASATLTGASATHYQLGTNGCTTPVAPDGGCEIGVVFAPTTTGSKTANLRVTDSNGAIVNVPLTGRAVAVQPVAPPAPTIGTATAGNASATVNWTPPTNNGGSAITGYSVRVFSGTGTTPVRTVTVGNVGTTNVTGLTNGTSYSFEVAATNAVGTGNPSARSNAVTPAGAPVTPAAPTASAGDTTATVTWTAPNNGGSAISGYTLQVFTGTTQVGANRPLGNVTSTTVTGLTNGTAYTFRVAATNANGTSQFSAASAAVTPRPPSAVPAIPATPTANPGNTSATVTWTAPNNGGSAITGYTLRVWNGTTQVGAPRVFGNVLTTNVTGLTNGTAYTFDVAATNAIGTSQFSTLSAPVTPRAVPGAPTGVTATAGNTAATVNWVAPASNGGSPITGYSVEVRTGTTVVRTVTVGNVLTTNVTGLTNNTAYNFRVAAVNAAGTGPLSTASSPVTPGATNPAPAVTARAPAVDATAVGAAANITATFSEEVTGVNTTTFAIRPAATPTAAPIAGTVTRSGTTNRWILDPTANLAADTRYTVTLTGGATAIRDLAGAPLAGLSWSYTTGPAPTVTARAAAVNAVAVPRANNITATFSEAVQGVSTTTFVIRPAATPNAAPIAGTVTRNGTTNQWILNPNATLAANTQYRVTLTGGATAIRDGANNPLANVTWTFTTGA
jgi:titin